MLTDANDASGPCVILRDVGHGFHGTHDLFHGLSMTLQPRHVYALVGPSGSGKSTLLSILAGWCAPAEGVVERIGVGKITWVFQNPQGVARRTARDHVALPFLTQGYAISESERRADELLERFGLDKQGDRPFRDLSGGEAERLMFARGIATHPSLLLVDEPTAQLDLHMAGTVNEHLGALSEDGVIVVVATHDERTRDAATDVIDLREYQ